MKDVMTMHTGSQKRLMTMKASSHIRLLVLPLSRQYMVHVKLIVAWCTAHTS